MSNRKTSANKHLPSPPTPMTVSQLIAALRKLPPSAKVILAGEGDSVFLSFIDTKYNDPRSSITLDGWQIAY